MTLSEMLSRLQGVKGSGSQYTAKCPAHDDRHASLSVGAGDDGRILMKCHAGCSTQSVLAVLGLTERDFFSISVSVDWTMKNSLKSACAKFRELRPYHRCCVFLPNQQGKNSGSAHS